MIGEIPGVQIASHQLRDRGGRRHGFDAELAACNEIRENDKSGAAPLIAADRCRAEAYQGIRSGWDGPALAGIGEQRDQFVGARLGQQRSREADRGALFSGQQDDLVGEEIEPLRHEPSGDRSLAAAARARNQDRLVLPAHRCAVKRNGNVEIMDETPHGLVEQDLDQFGGAVVLSDPSKIDVNCVSVGTSLGDVNRMIGQLQRDRRSLPKKQLERIAEFRRKIELHGPIGHRNDPLCHHRKNCAVLPLRMKYRMSRSSQQVAIQPPQTIATVAPTCRARQWSLSSCSSLWWSSRATQPHARARQWLQRPAGSRSSATMQPLPPPRGWRR
ncbi:MAG: hypothetical protein ACLP1D_09790 [Xanthobacteraceae bacterium]